eukprot:TRINITY_DN32397_c0_g1_i1.p1 TRINITY_DN32397_c0_g1~~TRINITY_DN32397_c0_g1_i1.p1  ORF type:complete len:705 (+),score=179.41 TRINITY_DN32397_c0_g1_i1:182-2296(+)
MKLSHTLLLLASALHAVTCELQIGTGISDATGPINDIKMMGMANPKQINAGLHQRLRSRAFVALDTTTKKRFAFISLDSGMGGIVLKNRVVAALDKQFPGLYTDENVGLSGTHTHSGPSGFLQDVIFQFSGSGWVEAVINAMVTGTVESVVNAHNNLIAANASVTVGQLADSNINRSPTAYLANPQAERDSYGANTDHNMTLLKFLGSDGSELGLFSWFAVHPTSMNNTNLLVSGDNKGYASYLFEEAKNSKDVPTGTGKFVAAFPSTNLGDVSPNTAGPRCRDTGLPCDTVHSTCNGRTEQCSAFGPGKDMFESCQIIGQKQYDKATELYAQVGKPLKASVDFVHSYVNMPGRNISDPDTGKNLGVLCDPAMGDSFAAGTTDGPGEFDFTQSANSSNPLWHFLVSFLHKSTPQQVSCQAPKGILLPTGSINFPWPWATSTVPVQILRLGELAILVVPSELTTMAGRRLRKYTKERMVSKGLLPEDGVVVIAGLGNGYTDYTTTYEEYQQQRYEGGSTIYGQHQLNAYIQEFGKLVDAMASGTAPASDAAPEDFSHKLTEISSGGTISTDYLPSGAKDFGQIMSDAAASYTAGSVASVTFAAGNPLNNLRPNGTFAQVQQCQDAACSTFKVIADDGDWETRVHVTKTKKDLVLSTRTLTVEWYIPAGTTGQFRIVHSGTSYDNPLIGKATFTPYQGTSAVFKVN